MTTFLGSFFGLMLVLAVYNFFLFMTIRDKLFLYYFFYISTSTYLSLRTGGVQHEFIWQNSIPYDFDINLSTTIVFFFVF